MSKSKECRCSCNPYCGCSCHDVEPETRQPVEGPLVVSAEQAGHFITTVGTDIIAAPPTRQSAEEALEALEAVRNYFWGTEPPILKEGDLQDLVEAAISALASLQAPSPNREDGK